jgi:hypothetical protein
MLRGLTAREGQVVRPRFGIGTRVHTRLEISERMGVPRQQVVRSEGRALRKLRETSMVRPTGERPATPSDYTGDVVERPPSFPDHPEWPPDDAGREANPWDEV